MKARYLVPKSSNLPVPMTTCSIDHSRRSSKVGLLEAINPLDTCIDQELC